jgi:hypothetical protein
MAQGTFPGFPFGSDAGTTGVTDEIAELRLFL